MAVLARRFASPLGVYLASRAFVLVAMEVAASASQSDAPLLSFTQPWDGIHYVRLAEAGYPAELTRVGDHVGTSLHAFFPLYPMLVRLVALLTPLGVGGSAVLLSLVAGAVAAVLLWRLAARLISPPVADGAVVLFAFFPASFVLSWSFSEGLMLALALGATLLLLDGRLWPAAGLCALATATRPNALPLVLGFLWLAALALRERAGWRQVVRPIGAAAVASLGFVAFHLYLWVRTGEPLAWFRVQREGFGEGVDPGRRTWQVLFEEFPGDIRTAAPLLTWLLVVLAVLLLAAVLRAPGLPGWLRLYAAVVLVQALTSNTGPASPRLQYAAFPAIIAAAALLRGELRSVALAGSSMLLVVLVIAYANPTRAPFFMWAL